MKIFITIILVCIAMENGCRNAREEITQRDESSNNLPGRFVRSIWIDSTRSSGAKECLAIVIYFENLGCMPCLNSLLELSDSLHKDYDHVGGRNVMLLIARTQDPYVLQRRKVEAWCAAHNLKFPPYLVSPDSLRRNLIERTSALLVNFNSEVELFETFPLSAEMSSHIIRRLREGS